MMLDQVIPRKICPSLTTASSGGVPSHSEAVCVAACEPSVRTVSSDVMCAGKSTNSKHQIILHELLHVFNFEKNTQGARMDV